LVIEEEICLSLDIKDIGGLLILFSFLLLYQLFLFTRLF